MKIFKTLTLLKTKTGAVHLLYFTVFVFFLFLISHGDCQAQEQETQIPQKRAEKDYSPFPQPDAGYITDKANILGKKAENRVERWLWNIEKKTKVEIIVVTIGSIKDFPGTPTVSVKANHLLLIKHPAIFRS